MPKSNRKGTGDSAKKGYGYPRQRWDLNNRQETPERCSICLGIHLGSVRCPLDGMKEQPDGTFNTN